MMNHSMSHWAEKLMKEAHRSVKTYEKAMKKNRDLPPVKKAMLYGRYLDDMNDAL